MRLERIVKPHALKPSPVRSGPVVWNDAAGGASAFDTLLTDNAVAIYSTRALYPGYEDAVIRVRRSSDNAESDFTAAEVSGGTMLTWVGAGSAYVTTMYDQVGSANMVQATTSRQPRIVNSGVQDQNPVFSGAQLLAGSAFASELAQPGTILGVVSRTNAASDQIMIGGIDASKRWQATSSPTAVSIYSGASNGPQTIEKTTTFADRVLALIFNDTDSKVWFNNQWGDVGEAGVFPLSGLATGGYFGLSNYMHGNCDHLIVLNKELSISEIDTASQAIATLESITLTERVLQIGGYNTIAESDTNYDFSHFSAIGTDGSIIVPFMRSIAHVANGSTIKQYKYDGATWTLSDVASPNSGRGLIDTSGGIDSTGALYMFCCEIEATSNVTELQRVFKSTNNGSSWSDIGTMAYPSGQLRFSPYGPLIEWPDTGSGRRLMQSGYSMSLAQAQAGSTYKPFVAFCDPDVDDTDWTEVVEIESSTTVLLTECGILRVSNTEAILVGRQNAGKMRQYKTTDRGQTWTYQGELLQSETGGKDVSPWLYEYDGLIYCVWVQRDITRTKMSVRYMTATAAALLASHSAWSIAGVLHTANHTTGLDICFPSLFEYDDGLKMIFSDKVNSTKPDLLVSDL